MKANNKIFCALLSIGLLSLTACSNSDDDSLSGATGDVTLSFGITMNDGVATRAISASADDNGTLKTGWTNGEEVTVGITHGGATTYTTAKVNQTSNDGKRAYVNMNVSGGSVSDGDAISVIYPALETLSDGSIDFASQDGTADSLSKYGLYKGSSTLEVQDNVARLKEDLGIAAQTTAYLGIKCTNKDGAALSVTQVSVQPADAAVDWVTKTDVTADAVTAVTGSAITATSATATDGRLYLAMPVANSGKRMTFTATVGDKTYTATKTWTGEAGGYYPVTLEMTENGVVASTADALTKAISGGQNIQLGADVTIASASGANLVPAKAQTIDLNGHTLTADNIVLAAANSDVTITGGTLTLNGDNGVEVQQQSKLTLDGVKLNATNHGVTIGGYADDVKDTYKNNTIVIKNSEITSKREGIVINNTGNDVTIENTTITHQWFGISENGTLPGSKITLTNVNISGPYSGIYLSNKAGGAKNTLVVNGGKIHSEKESAIEVKNTDITVTGATLESGATTQSYSVSNRGSNAIGYGIALVGYATGTPYEGNTSFSGNTYTLSAGSTAVKIGKYDGKSLADVWQEGY